MHRRKIAQASADVVRLLKIPMEKWAKPDIWGLSEMTIFFNFIRVLHKERGETDFRCFVDDFFFYLGISWQIFLEIRQRSISAPLRATAVKPSECCPPGFNSADGPKPKQE